MLADASALYVAETFVLKMHVSSRSNNRYFRCRALFVTVVFVSLSYALSLPFAGSHNIRPVSR